MTFAARSEKQKSIVGLKILMSSRDSVLLELSKISSHEHSYSDGEQLISHLVTQMRSTDKFVGFAATKAMFSVLISNNELAVHSLALTELFGDIQTAFMHPSLCMEFSLELISKLVKRFQDDHVRFSGVFQLYFECMQKLWPTLLELQLSGQHTVAMVPFLSLTCDILKFKFENDSCNSCCDGSHCVSNCSVEERTILSCQTSIVDLCTHKTLPRLLGHCSNLFEMKKCLGLFTKVCGSTLLHDCCRLCSIVLDSIISSSLVKNVLLNWLSLQSQSFDVNCIMGLFGIDPGATLAEIADADKSLLATIVRKLTVLIIKCLSVTMDEGKGLDWLCQLESVCKISTATDNCKQYEDSLRNLMLEILLDQDSVMVNAFCYCLKITKNVVNRKDVLSGSVICNVLNINLLFIKFLCAISHDHLVLMDYIISNETCFVEFLTCYLDYIHGNWSAFTFSHHKLKGIMKIEDTAVHCSDKVKTAFSLSRKRKHSQRKRFPYTSIASYNVQLECGNKEQTTKSLVAYDLSDSSEDDSNDQSFLHNTMSCIIRLRLALERMLAKQIIPNPQAPTKLVSMIERVETLYEMND